MSEITLLTVPRTEAQEKIEKLIKEGTQILRFPINETRDLYLARESMSFWTDYARELLLTIFSTDRISKEFSEHVRAWVKKTSFSLRVAEFRKILNIRVNSLRSILGRLNLFNENLIDVQRMPSTVSAPLPNLDTWKEIKKEYGMNKIQFGRKINFVTDPFKRKIIFRDVQQAYELSKKEYSKSAVTLAGGVIEELLRLYLEKNGVKPNSDNFNSYIETCEGKGLIKGGVNHLSESVRHFRNLVHMSKEKSARYSISVSAAKSAVASIFTIVNDFT